jgi:hypothetical protein
LAHLVARRDVVRRIEVAGVDLCAGDKALNLNCAVILDANWRRSRLGSDRLRVKLDLLACPVELRFLFAPT